MPAGPLQPGDPRVLGAFRVVGRLGEGGQGVVYEGRSASGDPVAIKVLRGGDGPDARRRLARELESARRVAPFCTARVLEADPDGPVPYVVSEFVAGPSLQERVRAGGPLRDGDLDRLAVGTAGALAAIHGAGVVHRDFKPANVLLGPDGPRVVDFGIARPPGDGTTSSTMSGTPPYMAPEQLRGEHGSAAADVFAWAATMVYAATGRAPFGSDTVAAVFHRILAMEPDLSGLPPGLCETLARCLSKDPRARPSARSLLIRLVDPGSPTVTVPDVGPVPSAYVPPDWQAPGTRRRTRTALPVVAVALAVLATAGVLYVTERVGGQEAQGVQTTAAGTGGLPGAFAGSWTGRVVSQDGREQGVEVTITLTGGQSTGIWADGECEQQVTLTRARSDTVLDLAVAQRGQCVGGDMTLTLTAAGTLDLVRQEGAGSLEYRGSLRRS